jgi:hypothetical protein
MLLLVLLVLLLLLLLLLRLPWYRCRRSRWLHCSLHHVVR